VVSPGIIDNADPRGDAGRGAARHARQDRCGGCRSAASAWARNRAADSGVHDIGFATGSIVYLDGGALIT